ncbi:MAG: MFS transporter [Gammaproteobacteria bacterium]|nr:MFS transporter [Gammaproteobacteria bacterium]
MPSLTIWMLSLCQAMMTAANSLVVTTSALVGLHLSGSGLAATLPSALVHIANTTSTMPASLLMAKIGRKAGFGMAAVIGMFGGWLAMYAITEESYFLFCLAAVFFGVFNGFGAYFRFAAAEVVEPSRKARALSYVLAGGVLAALIGPSLADRSKEIIDGFLFAGSYASLIGVYLLVGFAVMLMTIPKPSLQETSGPSRPLGEIVSSNTFRLAALAAAVGYANMAMLMNATPLAMHDSSIVFSDTALVIQWHVFAMFFPSFFTGRIIEVIGTVRVIMIGAVLGVVCIFSAIAGEDFWNYWFALFVLGLSWNFLFIGGSTLVTTSYQPAEKAKAQGANDFLVFGLVALGTLLAGPLVTKFGWVALNYIALPLYIVTLVFAMIYRTPATSAVHSNSAG